MIKVHVKTFYLSHQFYVEIVNPEPIQSVNNKQRY